MARFNLITNETLAMKLKVTSQLLGMSVNGFTSMAVMHCVGKGIEELNNLRLQYVYEIEPGKLRDGDHDTLAEFEARYGASWADVESGKINLIDLLRK